MHLSYFVFSGVKFKSWTHGFVPQEGFNAHSGTGRLRMFEGQGQKQGKGHLLYAVGQQRANSCWHVTVFCPLEGRLRGHFTTFFLHRKGTLKGTSSCFIYHRGIQEGTFAAFFSNLRAPRWAIAPPAPPRCTQACKCWSPLACSF